MSELFDNTMQGLLEALEIQKRIDIDKAYQVAKRNTKYNEDGKAVISQDDEWINETEWDNILQQIMEEQS